MLEPKTHAFVISIRPIMLAMLGEAIVVINERLMNFASKQHIGEGHGLPFFSLTFLKYICGMYLFHAIWQKGRNWLAQEGN